MNATFDQLYDFNDVEGATAMHSFPDLSSMAVDSFVTPDGPRPQPLKGSPSLNAAPQGAAAWDNFLANRLVHVTSLAEFLAAPRSLLPTDGRLAHWLLEHLAVDATAEEQMQLYATASAQNQAEVTALMTRWRQLYNKLQPLFALDATVEAASANISALTLAAVPPPPATQSPSSTRSSDTEDVDGTVELKHKRRRNIYKAYDLLCSVSSVYHRAGSHEEVIDLRPLSVILGTGVNFAEATDLKQWIASNLLVGDPKLGVLHAAQFMELQVRKTELCESTLKVVDADLQRVGYRVYLNKAQRYDLKPLE